MCISLVKQTLYCTNYMYQVLQQLERHFAQQHTLGYGAHPANTDKHTWFAPIQKTHARTVDGCMNGDPQIKYKWLTVHVVYTTNRKRNHHLDTYRTSLTQLHAPRYGLTELHQQADT